MRRKLWSAIVLVVFLPSIFFLAACAKNAVQSQASQDTPPEPAAVADNNGGQTAPADQAPAPASTAGEFANENIHFDFDSAVLSGQAQQILNTKADYLRAHPEMTVTVEGYCDERGTDAYNIALGERRAKSARDFLVNLGVAANRLQTLSYGEERPVAQGRDESSWAQNRRDQFVIQ